MVILTLDTWHWVIPTEEMSLSASWCLPSWSLIFMAATSQLLDIIMKQTWHLKVLAMVWMCCSHQNLCWNLTKMIMANGFTTWWLMKTLPLWIDQGIRKRMWWKEVLLLYCMKRRGKPGPHMTGVLPWSCTCQFPTLWGNWFLFFISSPEYWLLFPLL